MAERLSFLHFRNLLRVWLIVENVRLYRLYVLHLNINAYVYEAVHSRIVEGFFFDSYNKSLRGFPTK